MAHQNASSEGDHDNITWLDPVRDMEALEVQDRDDVCTMVRLQNNVMAISILPGHFWRALQPSVALKIKGGDTELLPQQRDRSSCVWKPNPTPCHSQNQRRRRRDASLAKG